MSTTPPLKVFLCHASADKPAIRKLYRYLKDHKIDVWLDAENLVAGQNWRDEIHTAIKKSDAIIVCLSKNAISKEGFIQKEIKFALEKADEMPEGRIFLIPIKLEECDVPDKLEGYHWVNLFEENGYRRLMKSLDLRAKQIESVMDISDSPHEEEMKVVEAKKDFSDSSVEVGGDVKGTNIIVGNHNVINVTPLPVIDKNSAPIRENKNTHPPRIDRRYIWFTLLTGLVILVAIFFLRMGMEEDISTPTPLPAICQTASVSHLKLALGTKGWVTKLPDVNNSITLTQNDIGSLTNLIGQAEFDDPNVSSNCVCNWKGRVNGGTRQDIDSSTPCSFLIQFSDPVTSLALTLYIGGKPELTVQYSPNP